tara:strand:+ start:741 stop:1577 length:837 start_codon:yes stop_codon:yes gene_type:complete
MPFSARQGFFKPASGGGADWQPNEITTQIWMKAESSEITASGTNVTSWNNKANGTGQQDFTQSTSSKQPTFDSTDKHVLFDGSDDFLQADSRFSFNGSDAICMVAVVDIVAYTSQFSGVADKFFQVAGPPGGGSGAHGAFSVAAGSGSVGLNNRFNNGFSAFGNGGTGVKKMVSSSMGAGDPYHGSKMFLNGADLGSRSSGSGTSTLDLDDDFSYLGGGPGGGTNQFMFANAKMYELVCIEDSSDTNRQLLEGYMAWEHGLNGSLPADHPYKNARPTV